MRPRVVSGTRARAVCSLDTFRLGIIGLSTLSLLLAVLSGCAPTAPAGVTAGGQQDIASARATIEDGGIPDPDSITVEGFLSEHSIPIEEAADAGLLYATASTGWHQAFDAFTPLATVQIGFGTTIDETTFERDSLNLCLVIDKSGSMADVVDDRSGTSKLDAVKIAIDRLLAQLDEDDLVSVVAFDSSPETILQAAAGNDIAAIKFALDRITADGGTDLETGLRRGYRVAREHSDGTRSDRLLVFTDALLTSAHERETINFIDAMEDYADLGVGATIFGIGVNFGHEVTYEISQVRGGNYFFLSDYDRIVSIFDDEFDYLVTPVAYDVAFEVSVPYVFDVVDIYGIKVEDPIPHAFELSVPTLFLSSRQGGGAIMVRLRAGAMVDFDDESTLADIALSYTSPSGETEAHPMITVALPAGLDPDAEEVYFESDSTKRGALLLDTALVLRSTCEDAYYPYSYWYYPPSAPRRAIDRLTDFLPYFDAMSEGLEDQVSATSRTLSQERALLATLLENIQSWYETE
ncbi:MAG: VWA domain-containing protein [Phycisphaerales bacterium]|nr:MAG: VWA domain-containing protein [Phycisphaerales bacterium]